MSSYPNLSAEKILSLDIETKDSDLKQLGPGYHRKNAGLSDDYIICFSIATATNTWWFPWNDSTKQFLKDQVSDKIIVCANPLYDIGWLQIGEGIRFTNRLWDILTIETLLTMYDEIHSLDSLAKKYLKQSKGDDEIQAYADRNGWKGDARKHLWKMPVDLVGRYNMADARQTYDIFLRQQKHLDHPVQVMESDLLPVLLYMKETGVRINENELDKKSIELDTHIKELQTTINKKAGFELNVRSGKQLQKAFDSLGLSYEKTEKGNPSFTEDSLSGISDPLAEQIIEIKTLLKLQSSFIEGYKKYIIKGRIYADFNPMKNENYGTETGRLSSSRPNLQQIPKRGIGKQIARSLYLPEPGHVWEKQDQSQEEYRVFAHCALGGGAEELRRNFKNPDFDMHSFMSEFTGLHNRDIAKTLNFLSLYGGGVHKFAASIGKEPPAPWSDFEQVSYQDQKQSMVARDEAARLFFTYHDNMPCIKHTANLAQKKTARRGYAKTMFDRRRKLTGYYTKNALNTYVQGTCGDIMKLWLIETYKRGIWDTLPLHLTVHDEVDFSVIQGNREHEEAAREVQYIGENIVPLKVPLKVDRERGPDWANVEDI